MTTIALFGAGGKMGVRLSKNLLGSAFEVRHVEPGAVGRQRLKDDAGLDCVAAGGGARCAGRLRARLLAWPHDHPVGGDLQADSRPVLRRLQQGHHLRQAALVRDDWKQVFERDEIAESIRRVT